MLIYFLGGRPRQPLLASSIRQRMQIPGRGRDRQCGSIPQVRMGRGASPQTVQARSCGDQVGARTDSCGGEDRFSVEVSVPVRRLADLRKVFERLA